MKRLREVILSYTDFAFDSLGDAKGRSLSKKERDQLQVDLVAVQKDNRWLVRIVVAMLLLLFVVYVFLVLINPKRTVLLHGGNAILGLSAAICIRWLVGIWREKTNTETLLRLATDLEGDALKTVIMVMAKSKKI
jgi:hypothetical protein